ncbi:MAG: DUF192 domain-containing protein [Candidatus Micrarchaeaceae archaeon]
MFIEKKKFNTDINRVNRKNIRLYSALSIIAVAAALLVLSFNASNSAGQPTSFTFANRTYPFTYVASNFSEWEAGLMNKTVTNSTFELFAFPTPNIYPFWMKDTYYPLDIIWINGTRIVYIVYAIPCSWYSKGQSSCIIYNSYNSSVQGDGHIANYVIEAQGGFANATGMMVGDTVRIS